MTGFPCTRHRADAFTAIGATSAFPRRPLACTGGSGQVWWSCGGGHMRHFGSRLGPYIFLVVAIGWSPASARADTIRLDQQNAGPRNGGFGVGGDTVAIAQTFSVGITGMLTSIDLGVFNPNNLTQFPDSLTIDVERTSAGRPGGTVLQSMTIPI